MCRFPSRAKAEGRTRLPVTGVARNEDFVISWTLMVNNSQAIGTDDESFHSLKGSLVVSSPDRESFAAFLRRQWSQNTGMLCQFW